MPMTKVAVRGGGRTLDVSTVPEPEADILLAVGEAALRSVVSEPPSVPVLPVDAGVGRHGVEREALADAVDGRFDPSAARTVAHPVLTVDGGDKTTRALFDVSLVTTEAARISEYALSDLVGELAVVRADGVVVATPLGSTGYAHAAGGPVLAAGAGLAVVPVSPYTTRPRTWVVDDGGVSVTVERDDCPVSLFVDGERVGQVPFEMPVTVEATGTVDLLRPPLNRRGLEKL